MARRYMRVYLNGNKIRTYGGNGSSVRGYRKQYLNMTEEEFLKVHPRWTDEVKKNGYRLAVTCPNWETMKNAESKNKYWGYKTR